MDELTCPQCGNRMRYNFEQSKIMCPNCGYSPLDARQEEVKAKGVRPHVKISNRANININAQTAFHTAHDHLHKGENEKALEHFKRALVFQTDFIDAHLGIADLVEDEATKRKHLSEVIAVDPGNGEALRRLMVLNGRLTQEEMSHTYHDSDQAVEHVDTVVAEQSDAMLCPVCGGQLTVDDVTGRVECKFCGHVEVREHSRQVGADSLAMALLERKVKPVRWVVGNRILHCNECGSERTIPARKLVYECPFCGSKHVVQQEPMEALQQPDGLIQFQVSRQEATAAIGAELNSFQHRIANLFDNNRIAHTVLEAVYLPYWLFDVFAQVDVTRVVVNTQSQNNLFSGLYNINTPRQSTMNIADSMSDVAICGVTTPARALTRKLGSFDFSEMINYQSKLLAKHPAELYNIDFDKASLEARGIVARALRDKHQRSESLNGQVEVRAFTKIQSMSFRLLLLPVWVASLLEDDGDIRAALVNGQTGEVALGKPEKR